MIRWLAVITVLLIPSTSQAPPQPIAALAPVETLVDGRSELVGVAVAADGTVYVSDRGAGIVYRREPSGPVTVALDGLDRPTGIVLDGNGRPIVAEEGGGRILRRESSGVVTILSTGLKTPRWLALGPDGSLYVSAHRLSPPDGADAAEGRQILRRARDGAMTAVATGIRQLQGLTIVGARLVVATKGLETATESAGTLLRYPILPDGTLGAPTSWIEMGLKQPVGVVADRLAAGFVASKEVAAGDTAHRAIGKVHAAGRLSRFAENLDDPQGLAIGPDGSLYVADGRAGRLVRFRAPPAPTLAPLPEVVNTTSLTVAGTAQPGARIDATIEDGATANTTTDAAGGFSLVLVLEPNTENRLGVFATAHDGDGLTSAPAEATVLHDDRPPAVIVLSPGPSGFVRGTVTVTAEGSDDGSGVASMAFALDGQTQRTVVNPGPGATVVASVPIATAGAADGARTLRVAAVDRAGNVAAAERTLMIDNTPPDTDIASGPSGTTSETTVTFTIGGTDNLTSPPSLQFAWRLDGSAWSPFAPTTTVTIPGLPQGPHTFEARARDLAGNEDPTPATRSFTIGGLRVTITEPVVGAVVPAGEIAVRGTVDAGGAETGVSVNGVPAAVDGGMFVALVHVNGDTTTVTAVGTAAGGTATHEVAIVVLPPSGASALLTPGPASGIAPLTVRFSLASPGSPTRIDLDANGDGVVDFSGARLDDATFTFTQPGIHVATAVVVNATGATTTARAVIHVYDVARLDALLRRKWTALKDALRRGDLAAALSQVTEGTRESFAEAFTAITAQWPAIDQILPDVTLVEVGDEAATYDARRIDDGLMMVFDVTFVKDGDGIWRLEAL